MIGLSGASLNTAPYKFKSETVISRYTNIIASTLHQFSFDIKKTSIKSFLGLFMLGVWTIADVAGVNNYFGNLANLTSWVFSMGGINYPFDNAISFTAGVNNLNLTNHYVNFLKYIHNLSNEGPVLSHNIERDDFDITGHFPIAAVFDKLDQNSFIMSGLSGESYDIVLELKWSANRAVQRLYWFFNYDVIVTFEGGELKLED